MTTQKLLVITSNQLPHKYFVNQLNSHFNLCAVFIEHFEYPDPLFNSNEERVIWNEFFLNRKKTEECLLRFNNSISVKNNPKILKIKKGRLNDDETMQSIHDFNPARIIIFGASLLETKYLEQYPNRILNLHVGLPQYYRGSSCNFWPIHDLKPHLLGATVHVVGKGIDDGNIVIQDTIDLEENDSEFVLMVKPIILGTKLMIEAIKSTNTNLAINGKLQDKGKLYLIKDFTPQSIFKVRSLVSSEELKQKIALENNELK